MKLNNDVYAGILLALLIWREARGESVDAQIAVACTVRERVIHPGWWGRNWVEVITKKFQYSSLADPNDKQLTNYPQEADEEFAIAMSVAEDVMAGTVQSKAQGATHYFDDSISAPNWAQADKFIARIGRLNFYRVA